MEDVNHTLQCARDDGIPETEGVASRLMIVRIRAIDRRTRDDDDLSWRG